MNMGQTLNMIRANHAILRVFANTMADKSLHT